MLVQGAPGQAGAGRAALEIPLPVGLERRTTYWQVSLRDDSAFCGLATTNGVAITVGN